MNEAMRNAIVERRQAKASVRGIARALGISRQSVQRVLDQVAAERGQPRPASCRQRPIAVRANWTPMSRCCVNC